MSLISRVQNILLKPKEEWAVIDAEPATVQGIFTSYVMILAAIGPIAMIIGYFLIHMPVTYIIAAALVGYVISLVTVYVNALIIDALAPTFNGTKDSIKALKVAAYSATPVWLVGVLNIVPQLAPLSMLFTLIAGVYGIYLLYLGLPRLMRVAEDKAIAYVAVVVIAWWVIYAVLVAVLATVVLSTFYVAAAPVVVYR